MYFSEADMTKPRAAAGATNYPIFDDGTAVLRVRRLVWIFLLPWKWVKVLQP